MFVKVYFCEQMEKERGRAPLHNNYQFLSLYGVFSTPLSFNRITSLSSLGLHKFLNHLVLPNHLTSVGLIA